MEALRVTPRNTESTPVELLQASPRNTESTVARTVSEAERGVRRGTVHPCAPGPARGWVEPCTPGRAARASAPAKPTQVEEKRRKRSSPSGSVERRADAQGQARALSNVVVHHERLSAARRSFQALRLPTARRSRSRRTE